MFEKSASDLDMLLRGAFNVLNSLFKHQQNLKMFALEDGEFIRHLYRVCILENPNVNLFSQENQNALQI